MFLKPIGSLVEILEIHGFTGTPFLSLLKSPFINAVPHLKIFAYPCAVKCKCRSNSIGSLCDKKPNKSTWCLQVSLNNNLACNSFITCVLKGDQMKTKPNNSSPFILLPLYISISDKVGKKYLIRPRLDIQWIIALARLLFRGFTEMETTIIDTNNFSQRKIYISIICFCS